MDRKGFVKSLFGGIAAFFGAKEVMADRALAESWKPNDRMEQIYAECMPILPEHADRIIQCAIDSTARYLALLTDDELEALDNVEYKTLPIGAAIYRERICRFHDLLNKAMSGNVDAASEVGRRLSNSRYLKREFSRLRFETTEDLISDDMVAAVLHFQKGGVL